MPWVNISALKAKRRALQARQTSFMAETATVPMAVPMAVSASSPLQPVASLDVDCSGSLAARLMGDRVLRPFDKPDVERSSANPIEMVSIPQGRFLMGSPRTRLGKIAQESPQHWVSVQSFQMGKFPVTQAEWSWGAQLPEVERSLPIHPSCFSGEQRPVENISWWDAREFCLRLSRMTGHCYRLPTEAEWEYACRARAMGLFTWGQKLSPGLANCQYLDLNRPAQTAPVGQFPANAFGLCDMHGNVWEWCADAWHETYAEAPLDGLAWLDSTDDDLSCAKVLRGGSWQENLQDCRSATRANAAASTRLNQVGFRVVREGGMALDQVQG